MSDFPRAHFESKLQTFVDSCSIPAPQIKTAITYVLKSGGKRLRPQLVYAVGAHLNVCNDALDAIAIAIELMHTYSLVHDDLPAMDNDDFRRGQPSCHKAFDEACAILTGDALQALAITALINLLPKTCTAEVKLKTIQYLQEATGPAGMISGQSLDLTLLTASSTLTIKQLETIHHLKTSSLILACIQMVFCVSHSDDKKLYQRLLQFGESFGLAYQMQDDYLDAYAPQDIGKAAASDTNKQTFARLYPKGALEKLILNTFNKAIELVKQDGDKAQALVQMVHRFERIKERASC